MKRACPGTSQKGKENNMNRSRREFLTIEANCQMKALKMISRWRTLAFGISAIGVALSYAGFGAADQMMWLGITGIVFILSGFVGAAILNLGIKNGRQNVNRILNAIESEPYGK